MFASIAPGPTTTISSAQTVYDQYYQQQVPQTVLVWQYMRGDERMIVDRLAADFYERSLRYSQTQAIEANTARQYYEASPPQRNQYRDERRRQWQNFNSDQQQNMRNAKRPAFAHLSENQKWPFREHALIQLGAAGAIDQSQIQSGTRPGI